MSSYAIVGCFAAVLVLTPLAMRLSWKIGAIDVPRDGRRMHTDTVPRAGGIAILAAFTAVMLLVGPRTRAVWAGLAGGLAVFCIGLADDVQPLPPAARLAVQSLAAFVGSFGAGIRTPAGMLGAVLWLLALTNAHNFIDGLDGLFAGTAAVEGIGIALVLFLLGQGDRTLQPLLLSAACAGFLRYNRPPARVFAGDCGSGAVGFLLGVAALPVFRDSVWQLGLLSPLLIFAYPLTDLTAAVLRRAAAGKSLFAADRAHLHHRICAMGVSQPVAAVTLCGDDQPTEAATAFLKAPLPDFVAYAKAESDNLVARAVEELSACLAVHDEIEAIYRPFVNYDRVNAESDALFARIGL